MNKENEKSIIESFLNLNHNINEVQKYIKEKYNVSSEYDSDNDTIYIWNDNMNENLSLASAKEHISENIGLELINVIYGKKQ